MAEEGREGDLTGELERDFAGELDLCSGIVDRPFRRARLMSTSFNCVCLGYLEEALRRRMGVLF